MIEHVQANIMNSHVKIKNMILIEIRIYCFILFLMTVANFFSTIVILKQLNNASSIDNKTLFITEYLNKTVPNFKVSTIKAVYNSSIKNDDEAVLVNEYLNKTMPNFKVNVIVPVVNAIIGSHATLICSGNYDHEFCAFTSPIGITYNFSSRDESYENGRITKTDINAKECGMQIAKVIPNDNGIWHCNVKRAVEVKNRDQYYQVDDDEIILRTFYNEDLHGS